MNYSRPFETTLVVQISLSIDNRDFDFSDILDVFVELSEVSEADLTKWTTVRFSFVL